MEPEAQNFTSNETPANVGENSADIIAKHRKKRSDAGKPRGARAARVEVISGGGQDRQESSETNSTPLDVESVRKGVSAFLKMVDSLLVRKTYATAKQVTGDEQFSRTLAADVSSPKEENELISDLTANVAQRHEILAKFAPEVLLLAAIGNYGTRVGLAFKQLNDLAETQARLGKPKDNGAPN